MRKQRAMRRCAVCHQRDAAERAPLRDPAWLCPIHATIARGIIPPPTTLDALRSLFPARVTEAHRRTRAA